MTPELRFVFELRASVGPITPHVTRIATSAAPGVDTIPWPWARRSRAIAVPSPWFCEQPYDST